MDLKQFNSLNKEDSVIKVRRLFNISDYILTVGRIEPRKNHLSLLIAYKKLRHRLDNVGPLVIVGKPDFGYARFFEKIKELELEQHVKIISSLEDDMLPDIYRAARLFVYPSYAEGFGIPPIEAMASGVPVISSNTTAISEVVGNGGILVDPIDINEITEQMNQVLTDPNLEKKLSDLGRKQAEKWSWSNAGQIDI